MSKTRRDHTRWFWKEHFKRRGTAPNWYREHVEHTCWCYADAPSREWRKPYAYDIASSSFNRDQRRLRRGNERAEMRRARAGHRDGWDSARTGTSKTRHRDYYW